MSPVLPPALDARIEDYAGAERFVLALVRDDPRPYAARASTAGAAVRALLARLGDPQRALRFLHVAGSKGKGSVALMAECLAIAAGSRTGTYTSPHLRRWNERFRVAGTAVDDATMIEALERTRAHVAAVARNDPDAMPSFFDVLTAAAMDLFARAGCDLVVLETGLGGLLDATNVVSPAACCITSIELEHTDKLGTTLAAIAHHKAGILKPGVPAVVGEVPREAMTVIAGRLAQVGAPALLLGRDVHVEASPAAPGRQRVRYRDDAIDVEFDLPHPARHMADNAALAIALTRAAGLAPDPAALAGCELPARAQVMRSAPWFVVDGAHTAASLRALGEMLADLPARRRRFVVSSTLGKPPDALAALLAGAERVVVTRADPLRSASAAALAAALAPRLPGVAIDVDEDPRRALADAARDLGADELLCACGSVYLAGLAQEVLGGA